MRVVKLQPLPSREPTMVTQEKTSTDGFGEYYPSFTFGLRIWSHRTDAVCLFNSSVKN